MRRPYNKPKKLESLLPQVAKQLGIESRIKESMILNYWQEVAGGKVGRDTRPHSLVKTRDGMILYVGAKSAIVAQEINMVKMVLLDQLNALASQVGVRISNINVSTKYWQTTEDSVLNREKMAINMLQNDPIKLEEENIELSSEQIQAIEEALIDLDSDVEVKGRLRKVMQKDMMLKELKRRQGMPVCKKCGVSLQHMDLEYCPSCRYNQ